MREHRLFQFTAVILVALACATTTLTAQSGAAPSSALRVRWEEITAVDFPRAVDASARTCILPLGILEKHGPHLPLGTDLINARATALRAAEKEYAVVFPEYFVGQIFEAQHQPGTVAYGEKLMWEVLQETCDQIARNGFRKILIVSGHGGNSSFLPYFCQAQLARRKDYAVLLYRPSSSPDNTPEVRAMRKTQMDQHAGEVETSVVLANRPELVRLDQAGTQSGADQNRLPGLGDVYSGIWWYARFPNHYAGDGSAGTRELGERIMSLRVEHLARTIGQVKANSNILELQKLFFDEVERVGKK